MPEQRILMGVVGRPHGVRGLVHVTSYTANPADLPKYGPLTTADGRSFALRWTGAGVAEISEIVDGVRTKIADRNAAERLTNLQLFVARDRLKPAGKDEFYLADLIGLEAVDASGATLGRIAVVHDYGAGVSLEIARDTAPALLLPFTRACVPEVDIAGGRAVVVPPEEIVVAAEAAQ